MKYGKKNTPYTLANDTTVEQLKHMIAEQEEMAADDIELIWSGQRMDDNATIQESGLQDNTTIHLVMRLVKR